MLLKRLKLKDFRQFVGEQEINFSVDQNKNVTIIMGQNGAGKTTLAQAFTWCLYGETDFQDKSVLAKAKELEMEYDTEATVKVEIELEHLGKEYTINRKQTYYKNSKGLMKKPDNTIFRISYKSDDGQQEFVNLNKTELVMKEILPKELSRYFFFDGERIESMSKDIKKGKVQEFANAVRGLLGLNAIMAGISHLKSAIRSYEGEYDSKSDSKIKEYTDKIQEYQSSINKIDKRLEEIAVERETAQNKISELEEEIARNSESEELAKQKEKYRQELNRLQKVKNTSESALLKQFNKNGSVWISNIMIQNALDLLKRNDKIDKGIPDIHKRTIDYLINNRHKCICGTEIEKGSQAYKNLMDLLEYIPPKSIGNMISGFTRDCQLKYNTGEGLFEDIKNRYSVIREFEDKYNSIVEEIEIIENKIKGMKNVGELQRQVMYYRNEDNRLDRENTNLLLQKGANQTSSERCESERNKLVLKDSNNKKVEELRAYAIYMHDVLKKNYEEEEAKTRVKLEKTINDIFHEIYLGGFSLKIDNKYNIQVIVDNYENDINDIETSTAQSISIIFAFIAGVIKMARENKAEDNEMLLTEAYPLVMDAPLSAFDKTRIETVCKVLPKVAEQVIIFIKDTDGEIAEEHMNNQIGARYAFAKNNEFETILTKRG